MLDISWILGGYLLKVLTANSTDMGYMEENSYELLFLSVTRN